MTILQNDVKLLASRVMDDVPEGGGAPTSVTIVDGASNQIFSDISELDRAGGDVSLRKLFVHVQTDDRDTYLGANMIVAKPPEDPNVTVTIFSTGQTFDERASASGRIESYLVAGPDWGGYLLENHIAGQRAIQIFQRVNDVLPNIGETLVLVYREGLSGERTQYVRVIRVSSVVRKYTDIIIQKEFDAATVTVELSDPLRYDFPGSRPSIYFAAIGQSTKIRSTNVGDAAVYAGISPITTAINLGDISAEVESVFTQLVPSAQTEIPLIDQTPSGPTSAVTRSSDGTISYTTAQIFNADTVLSVGSPITPGTLQITIGSSTLVDTGGQLFDGATAVGVIDYSLGTISFSTLVTPYSGTKTVTFATAAAPLRLADTALTSVTEESRAYNYVLTIQPPPAPGTAVVNFRSQGRWYELRDNGGGVLKGGDSSYGVGTVSYATGTVSVTLGALPDVGSAILYSWGAQVNYLNRSAISVPSPSVVLQLAPRVQTSSITVTWNDGSARTATDNGKGLITGDATGTVDYDTGLVRLTPNNLPAGGQQYDVGYSLADLVADKSYEEVGPVRESDTTIIMDLGETGITPGTVKLTWDIQLNIINTEGYFGERAVPAKISAKDNGFGSIIVETGRVAGTVNYATGVVQIQPDGPVLGTKAVYTWTPDGEGAVGGGGGAGGGVGLLVGSLRQTGILYETYPTVLPITGKITAKFRKGGTPVSATPVSFNTGALRFDITNRYGEQIVPGSVNFTLGTHRYFDRVGSLYTDLNVVTGEATLSGTINYTTGEVALTNWSAGASSVINLDALLTTSGNHTVGSVRFRVPVSPVRPGSLQILATKAEGGSFNITAGIDGVISGPSIKGTIDYQTGVVSVDFGALVPAGGNESQPWYQADHVVAGDIWKPTFVLADTIRFNAVAFSYLPLDANILGLDPVRLPQDGRVPIFRPGGFAVIGHTKNSSPMTVTNGQTVDLARVRLSRVRVIGNNGQTINAGYTQNLEAGTVTFTDVTGYSQPVTIEDRIEDMAQISDVQINGVLAFTRQITHNYPVGSYISSALIANDLKSRVSITFDQASWNAVEWVDTLVGDAAPATYNTTTFPFVVTNRGAITERWALRFLSSTSFQVIGEHVGVIDVGNINTVTAPLNPATGTPYFSVPIGGWGSGWSVGNVVRFNTVGAMFPAWIVRTVQQGATTVIDDEFTLLVRGDVDRP